MANFSTRTAFCLATITIFAFFCFPAVAQPENRNELLIQQVTNKEGVADACAGLAAPAKCPVNCFRADPVCGVDGVTYWCGCADATCAGVRVAKLGACELGNGGAASLPRQALLLVHIVWLFLLGFSLLFGLF
ncbi:hypothetical protein Tsubulata_006920 [Turnera subulata]|uniref:Kazal-like domain-containing protein n=1 Tax=Turnera subulata TaxID=218843 RepID=A0A9Q0GCK9_9ROSI|nr:hypothetical protein Tsubulata_006920 [Turnera subulata]